MTSNTTQFTRLSDVVTLRPNGLFVGDHQLWPDELLSVWRNELEVEPGTPLGSFLEVLRDLPEQDLEAIEHITHSSLAPFLAELGQPVGVVPPETDFRALVIQRYAAVRHYNDITWVTDAVDISGMGDQGETYAIDFTPVNHLAAVPMYVSRTGEVECDFCGEPGNPGTTHKVTDNRMTVGEFTTSVLDEITWFGHPANRDGTLGELIQTAKEFHDGAATEAA